MIDRLEMLRRRLESFYDLAMGAESEKYFFLWLYDYVRVFDGEDDLGGIFESVKKQRDDEFKPINDLMPKVEKEIEKTYKKVAKYVADNKIDHKVILKELEEYVMAKDGRYTSSRGHLADLYDKVSYALMTMAEDGTVTDLKFAQQFGNVSDERRITDWTFSPSYTEYDLLTTGIKKIQETRLWYCWDKLVIAFKAIDDFKQEIVRDQLDKNKHFEAMNWSGLWVEMQGIIDEKNNRNDRPYEFISKDYRYYLAKVHQFAEEYVQSNPRPSQYSSTARVKDFKVSPEVKWTIADSKVAITITVNGKPITFASADRTGVTLKCLMDSENEIVSWDEIYQKWTGKEPESSEKSELKLKVYWNIDAIVKRIANETGVTNLVEYKAGDVTFNPRYIRIPDQTNS